MRVLATGMGDDIVISCWMLTINVTIDGKHGWSFVSVTDKLKTESSTKPRTLPGGARCM